MAEDLAAPRLPLDVSDFHTCAVDWTRERCDFLFPEESTGDDAAAVPVLEVDHLRGYRR